MPSRFLAGALLLGLSAAAAAETLAPPLPSPPNVPESAYPACIDNIPAGPTSTVQLRAFRMCRSNIELFRDTYFNQFKIQLDRYKMRLATYRSSLPQLGLTEGRRRMATIALEQAEEQLLAGGDLVEAKRRLDNRIRTNLAFIGREICRIRRRPDAVCA